MIEEACNLALAARAHAYCPYSNYPVGAAIVVQTESGPQAVGGCNVENASFGLCQCAERSAICTSVALFGALPVSLVVVATKDGGTPCGACRQVISEFAAPDCQVICLGENGIRKRFTMADLLPEAFQSDELGRT